MVSSERETRLRKIGEYLPCSPADIEWALSIQAKELASGIEKPLGEILLEDHLVTQEALEQALQAQLIDHLNRSSLLKNLDREQLAQIGARTDKISLDPGETLFKQGNRGNSMYVVLQGRLLLSRLEDLKEYASGAVAAAESRLPPGARVREKEGNSSAPGFFQSHHAQGLCRPQGGPHLSVCARPGNGRSDNPDNHG